MRLNDWYENPYIRLMRLHQPTGIWLLLWPCLWSYTLYGTGFPNLCVMLLFVIGAVLMRSVGCIVNDWVDRDLDGRVERTRNRPLASGELSTTQAAGLAGLLLSGAFAVALLLGWKVALWSMAVLPLVTAYPYMKRITWWPQAFLGLTFNWGVFVGAVAVRGEVDASTVFFYLGCACWTVGYDTIYAHQDKKDDRKIGIRSSALRLGEHTRSYLWVFYSIAVWLFFIAGLGAPSTGPLYFFGLTAVFAQLSWQIARARLNNPASCYRMFCSNIQLGGIMLAACLAGKII